MLVAEPVEPDWSIATDQSSTNATNVGQTVSLVSNGTPNSGVLKRDLASGVVVVCSGGETRHIQARDRDAKTPYPLSALPHSHIRSHALGLQDSRSQCKSSA